MKKILLIFLLFPGILYSQTDTSVTKLNEIDFYLELIKTIENYEKYSSLSRTSHYDKYYDLFSTEAEVFDDIKAGAV